MPRSEPRRARAQGHILRTWLRPVPPFRLDLTVAVLQRLPSNPVEVWNAGRYVRAFETPRGPVAWLVTQERGSSRIAIELHGPVIDSEPWRRRLSRAIGADADLTSFYRRARRFPTIAAVVRRAVGVKPPRFQSFHEAFASVILFQQVSLAAAVATLRRMVTALAQPIDMAGVTVWPFPGAGRIASCSIDELKSFGMSGVKARSLQEVATAVVTGAINESVLEAMPSELLEQRLRQLHGVGPWSAALLSLRGFGRLDRFPPGDALAERLLHDLGARESARSVLEGLGDTCGMLYYHLLLDRLAREHRGPFAPERGAERGAG